MIVAKNKEFLISLVNELRKLPNEIEWVEFKQNRAEPDQIGEYISALSNSSVLVGKTSAYIIWGIDNETHDIIGTSFSPYNTKIGNEELENWLLRLLSPKIDFQFNEFEVDDLPVVLLEISRATNQPVKFKNIEYIRIGSYKKKLKDYPELERKLWRIFDITPFESLIAAENVTQEVVLMNLDFPAYFDLLKLPLPENRDAILSALENDELITPSETGKYNITNLGAVLFAKSLTDYNHLRSKTIRVIFYKGNDRIETKKEFVNEKGYASGFRELIATIMLIIEGSEVIDGGIRMDNLLFPEIAIRELIANALIHQDFHQTGTYPMIEIFSNRIEITNPGTPLVKTDRFIDNPPKSRNEALASFMRRIGICEERGSGIDKVIFQTEFYHLPAPIFETSGENTRTVLFSRKTLREMESDDKIRACYFHACLKYVKREFITNESLRERFEIEKKNSAMVSRIIKETTQAGLIKPYDEKASRKFMKYIPFWG